MTGLGAAAIGTPAWHGLSAAVIGAAHAPAWGEGRAELHYSHPADEAELLGQGLPVGNGRLGALCGGPPSRPCLYLSEGSMWLGGRNAALGDDGQFPYAEENFGTFQMLAKFHASLPGHDMARVRDYRRVLDIRNGIARTRYRIDGVEYRQIIFVSHPDDVLVMRWGAGAGGRYDGSIALDGTHSEALSVTSHGLCLGGTLVNGLRHGAALAVRGEGGRLVPAAGAIRMEGCDALTIVIAGGTDYAPDIAQGYRRRGHDPQADARDRAERAMAAGADRLLANHEADHRALFDAMTVDLGRSSDAQRGLDIGARLAARARPGAPPDPELDALYLQFGRYLTIAGSRGGLPSNLQGLWLANDRPPWMSDYHTDINVEMNYWLPDRAGLPACFTPLTDYCASQYPSWSDLTARLFNDPRNRFRNSSGVVAGWTVAISLNIHGGMGWWWHPAGGAWLCNNLWQHYQYSQDRGHLERIYPWMKEACRFWEARLVETTVQDAAGRPRKLLVDDHDWSPEQGPDQARGISYAQELVWDLFENYRKAAGLLARDAAYARRVRGLQARLYLPGISPVTGELEEWMSPRDLGEPRHRHLSPLFGLFPGDRIRADRSPRELVAAARRLLESRGMRSTGWGNAWRAICWARLKDGEKAYQLLTGSLAPLSRYSGTAINFFNTDHMLMDGQDNGSPDLIFQIDGNYGMPVAMLEMLLYSRDGLVEILPALPAAWAARGRVTGLGARGGFRVDVSWEQGVVTRLVLHSAQGGETDVQVNGQTRHVALPAGGRIRLV